MKPNASNAWAIASGKVLMPWSVRDTRAAAIHAVVTNWQRDWTTLLRQGNTAVKIRMVPVEK